jgi:polar amino acid transport system substrate-binding protein
MKLRGIFILILTLNVGLCATLASAQERVKLQTIEEFDRDGKPVPLAKATSELLSYIEKTLNIHFQIQRVPWKRAMSNALKEDLVLMGMSINKERLTKYLFSDAINANGNWLVTRCDARFPFNNIQDLKGKLIGVVAATSAGEAFDGQIGKLFTVENDIGAGISRLQKLMAKRMDALVWYDNVDAPLTLEYGINLSYGKRGLSKTTGDTKPFCVLPKPISIVSNHFAMRISPANRQLLNRINQAMAKGRKEGAIPPAAATILN